MNTTAIQAHTQRAAAGWSTGRAAYERISRGIAAVQPCGAGGAYVNFMMDEGAGRVAASYRGNYARLAAVKKRYGPGNLFRVDQNIAPARAEATERTASTARGDRNHDGACMHPPPNGFQFFSTPGERT